MITQKKIILANLKAYRSPALVEQWCGDFLAALQQMPEEVEIILAVPHMALERVWQNIEKLPGISLAAQVLSSFPQGSYTGTTPAAWLRGLVRYSLAGHRERRNYFHETVQDVARQVHEALEEDITPIVCVEGEYFVQQLAAFTLEERERIYWAFTPKLEIGLVLPRDLNVISEAIAKIAAQGGGRPVLYGGGISADNVSAIWALPGISGIMLGEVCRDAGNFAGLVQSLS